MPLASQVRPTLPVYATGTVAGNAGQAVVTGTNTNWIATDPSGLPTLSVTGGDLFVAAPFFSPVRSVDSATQITLEVPLSATLNAGTAYRIVKVTPNVTGAVLQALLTMQQIGSDATPDLSRTIDGGAGRMKLRVGPAGTLQIAVGPSGASDAALITALDITQAGLVGFPAGNSYLTADFKLAMEANTPGWVGQLYACQAVMGMGQGDSGFINFNRPFARPGGRFEALVSAWMQTPVAQGGLAYTASQAAAAIVTLRAAAAQIAA